MPPSSAQPVSAPTRVGLAFGKGRIRDGLRRMRQQRSQRQRLGIPAPDILLVSHLKLSTKVRTQRQREKGNTNKTREDDVVVDCPSAQLPASRKQSAGDEQRCHEGHRVHNRQYRGALVLGGGHRLAHGGVANLEPVCSVMANLRGKPKL